MSILVATDFSTRSDRALLRAVLIARECDAALTLIHVIDDDQPGYLIDRQRASASEMMAQGAMTIANIDKISTEAVIATGDPFEAILATADDMDADLIVIGPHRRQLSDMFIGTTGERIIRRTRRPVLVANGVPSAPYSRCLLAVDLDESSRTAIEAVKRLRLHERTQLIALHLFDAPAAGKMKVAMEMPEAVDHYVNREKVDASLEFSEFLSSEGLSSARQILRPDEGSPSAAIVTCAEDEGADLIVMGTNQHSYLRRFLLGSVAQEVLLNAKHDVLVAPPPTSEGLRAQ